MTSVGQDGTGRAESEAPHSGRLDRSLVTVMAVATGLAVANNYYAQPLLPVMGRDLHLRPGVAGLIVTVAQVGYALGLVLLLPLGDLLERRRLVAVLSVGTGLALFWLGASPSAAWLLPASLTVGALSVLAQILVPFSASLAPEAERGRVVGMVMSGLLIGILLARTVAGLLAAAGTWRSVYFVAGAAMVVQGGVLGWRLPRWREANRLSYPRLIWSVAELLRDEPVLRLRSAYGLFSFGTFSVLWTSMAFQLARRYHYSPAVIGLFGLAGAAGAVTATVAGRLSDKGHGRRSTAVATFLLVASWAALWVGGTHLVAMVVGIVVLDIGAQGVHITNQGEIYRLRPEARSRLTAAYMFVYFVGGAVGSVTSALVYDRLGWGGVCLVGAALAAGSFLLCVAMWLRTVSFSQ
ncbi:MAG TPA: MFS transporter [Acidimicrobiales bacterium]|nr:MFS transporter [Acidimicrobiales bacterium]